MYRVILGMAQERDKIIQRCKHTRDQLIYHLAKVVVYGDSLQCYNHWIQEIANMISKINKMSTKGTRTGKLKPKDYMSYLFGIVGNYSISDARSDIEFFQSDNLEGRFGEPYPDFEINSNVIKRMYDCGKEVIPEMSKMLSEKNQYDMHDISVMLREIFDKHCL